MEENTNKTIIETLTEGYATNGADDAKRHIEEVERRVEEAKTALAELVKSGVAAPLQLLQHGFENSEPVRKRGLETKVNPNDM